MEDEEEGEGEREGWGLGRGEGVGEKIYCVWTGMGIGKPKTSTQHRRYFQKWVGQHLALVAPLLCYVYRTRYYIR